MDVPRSSLEGLSQLSEVELDDQQFQACVQAVFSAAVSSASTKQPEENKALPNDSLPLKLAFASTLSLVLEAARHDAPTSEVTTALEESKLSDDRIQYITKQYEQQKDAIRKALSSIGSVGGASHVVGLKWRLDYHIKSNLLEQVRVPSYMITLNTQQPDGTLKDIQFSCNLEELQDLLYKLKDAEKQVTAKVAQKSRIDLGIGGAVRTREHAYGRLFEGFGLWSSVPGLWLRAGVSALLAPGLCQGRFSDR